MRGLCNARYNIPQPRLRHVAKRPAISARSGGYADRDRVSEDAARPGDAEIAAAKNEDEAGRAAAPKGRRLSVAESGWPERDRRPDIGRNDRASDPDRTADRGDRRRRQTLPPVGKGEGAGAGLG